MGYRLLRLQKDSRKVDIWFMELGLQWNVLAFKGKTQLRSNQKDLERWDKKWIFVRSCCAGRQSAAPGGRELFSVLSRAQPGGRGFCWAAKDWDPSSFLAFLELLPDFPGLGWLWRGVVTMRIRILGLEKSKVCGKKRHRGSKSRAAKPPAGRQSFLPDDKLSSRAAKRSLVRSFCWISCLMLLLELCFTMGLRTSPYLHYNLILDLGSLSN
ncbi:hypothetical protein Tco_0146411 [Tanacetum coccineum]